MLRPYRDEDWNLICDTLGTYSPAVKAEAGPAWTYENGVPLMAGGVVTYWPGSGLAWFIASPEIRTHPVLLMRVARRVFHERLVPEFHRIEALIEADFAPGFRFMQGLGFKFDSVALQFGPSREHFVRFVYLR